MPSLEVHPWDPATALDLTRFESEFAIPGLLYPELRPPAKKRFGKTRIKICKPGLLYLGTGFVISGNTKPGLKSCLLYRVCEFEIHGHT